MHKAFFFMVFFFMAAGLATAGEVVIYTSVDQVFSQPVLEKFEQETGIKVRALYDVEASQDGGGLSTALLQKKRDQRRMCSGIQR